MAYGFIPDYKDEAVVCQKECQHKDCAATREDFIGANTCLVCGEELKIGDAFLYLPEYSRFAKAHFHCKVD